MIRDLNVDQIRKIWMLELILQTGSFRKAASLANVSPSAVSQALASLEQSVGRPLVVRERGTVSATAEAQAILSIVRPAFDAFDRLREIDQVKAPAIRWLNFGAYESIAIDVLPNLLQALRAKLPLMRLNLRITRTASLLSMVRKGELCSALVAETDDLDRFYVREVYLDRLGFYVARGRATAELGWKAIERLGLGSLSGAKTGLPRYFTKFLRNAEGVKPFLLCESFETLRAAAVAGSVVAVLPERVARRSPDLLEIVPPRGLKDRGEHRILIVSQANCDREEADFMAAETGRILADQARGRV